MYVWGAWKVTGQGELRNERMKREKKLNGAFGRGLGVSPVCLCGEWARGVCEYGRKLGRKKELEK